MTRMVRRMHSKGMGGAIRAIVVRLPLILILVAPSFVQAGWDAETFASQSTIELWTVDGDGEGHWSKVWVVVLDGEPYVRLGDRTARRVEGNATAPIVRVRVAGEELERIRLISVPGSAEVVAAAMAEKYWSDLFIRFVPHPLTMRLVPEDGGAR